jgi:septal ring factor EnvC (AmiA/AmiB activator)
MICPFATIRRLGVGLAFVALPLVAGCGGVSQEEMAAIEKQQLATETAEQKVADLQAQKADLESQLAEKKATKRALEEKLAGTQDNLNNE